MKRLLFAIGILSLMMLGGCASSSVTRQAEKSYPKPDSTHGIVYFYRIKAFTGAAVSYDIHQGDKIIGSIKNGTYFYQILEPSRYQFWAKTEARKEVIINVEAGKTYYVKCEVGMGILVGRPKMTIVADITGENEIMTCTYATLNP